jgi:hypothetical protein
MTSIQLNLVMKLMDGDMLEWIHGTLHGIKAGPGLAPAVRGMLAGTPFGSRVLPMALLYSLMNEVRGVRASAVGWGGVLMGLSGHVAAVQMSMSLGEHFRFPLRRRTPLHAGRLEHSHGGLVQDMARCRYPYC